MRKIISKIAGTLLGLSLAVGVGIAISGSKIVETKAGEITFTVGTDSGNTTLSKDGVSVSTTSGTFSRTDNYRVYANNSMTVSVDSGTITGMEFTISQNTFTADVGTWESSSWSGSSQSVTLSASGGQVRFTTFTVTTSGGGTVTNYTITYDANGGSGIMADTVSSNPAVAECTFTAPEGKRFARWNSAANGSGEDYAVGATPKADLDLFAIWEDKPQAVTLDKIGTSLGSTANTTEATVDILDGSDTYTLNYFQCKKQDDAMFVAKNVSAYISNHTEIPGVITSVELFINSGASGSATYDVAFGSAEYHSATAGVGAVNITGGNSHVFENASVSDATYFCITLGASYNGQVLKIVVNYEQGETPDPSKKDMVIYTSGNPANGGSFYYSSSEGTHVFSAYEDETLLSDVTWSVSDSTVATINASTGAVTTLKPGSVTIYAEAEGYNKASASVEFIKGALEEIEISGSMTKTAYTTNDSWDRAGLIATGTYHSGWQEDVSSSAVWTFAPAAPADGVDSVVVTATLDEISDSSSPQSVSVTVAHAGDESDPFTVAEGIAKAQEIGNVSGGEGPWVTTGKISSVVQVLTTGYQNARFYITEDGKTTSPSIYAYDCKYLENAGFTEETGAEIVVGATVTITGKLLNYNNNTPEYARGCYLLDIQAPATGDVDVTFAPASTSFEIGASGIFTASSETSGAVFTWDVDDSSILSVNSSTGAYEALALGVARVTVTASAGGKQGTAFLDFTVNGNASTLYSVSEANTIASGVISGQTTAYYIYVKGYVKEFATSMSGTSPRAFDITDLSESNSIMVYTNISGYSDFVDGLSLGDYIVVKANVQNYSGTYELTSPEKVSASSAAMSFALDFMSQTDAICTGYKEGDDNSEALEAIWGGLATSFGGLSEAEQGHLIDTTGCGSTIIGAMARYDYLVKRYSNLDRFVAGRVINGAAYGVMPTSVNNNASTIIIVVVALTSITSIGVLLVIKRRRSLVK